MANNSKVIQQIITDLASTNDELVLTTIVKARQKGDKTVVPALVGLLEHSNSTIADAARNTLFDLKDKTAVEVLLNEFDSVKSVKTRNLILQSLWQSNIQPVENLARLMKIAVTGTFEESIEIYSIVTNMIDVQIPDEELTEAIFIANNHIESMRNKQQKQLVLDMVAFLQSHE